MYSPLSKLPTRLDRCQDFWKCGLFTKVRTMTFTIKTNIKIIFVYGKLQKKTTLFTTFFWYPSLTFNKITDCVHLSRNLHTVCVH